ncbi:MAG: flagellar hook assembly protein FlgD [Deltaproteobacteria bacterium]|nr:flagellar hook assembly protein FlgD [Deltaproteobacteria bacterium]
MPIAGLDSILANQVGIPQPGSATVPQSLGKDAFLKLLVTQLQYQDPLSPMENTEFTAQLAQFSSLEQLTEMGLSMAEFSKLQGSINNIQALSFIGKQISAKGNIVEYSGQEINLNFELDDNAEYLKVEIYDMDGNLVRTIEETGVPGGDVQCFWDGKDNTGHEVAGGRYTFKVEAIDIDGAYIGVKTYAVGKVTGVRYDHGITYLIIGNKEVTISEVEKILG